MNSRKLFAVASIAVAAAAANGPVHDSQVRDVLGKLISKPARLDALAKTLAKAAEAARDKRVPPRINFEKLRARVAALSMNVMEIKLKLAEQKGLVVDVERFPYAQQDASLNARIAKTEQLLVAAKEELDNTQTQCDIAKQKWLIVGGSLADRFSSKLEFPMHSLEIEIKALESAVDNGTTPEAIRVDTSKLEKLKEELRTLLREKFSGSELEEITRVHNARVVDEIESNPISYTDEAKETELLAHQRTPSTLSTSQSKLNKMIEDVKNIAKQWKENVPVIESLDGNGNRVPVSPRDNLLISLKEAVKSLRLGAMEMGKMVDIKELIVSAIGGEEGEEIASQVDFSHHAPDYRLGAKRVRTACDAEVATIREELRAANTKAAADLVTANTKAATELANANDANKLALGSMQLKWEKAVAQMKAKAAADLAAAKAQAATELAAANGQVDIAAGLEEVMKFDKAGSNESTEAALTAAVKAQKEAEEKGNKKMWIAIIISSVVFVLAGVGAFFFLRGRA